MPDPALVAVQHRRQAAAQAAAVELHVGFGSERGEHLLALAVGELVQGELVVVAHEGRPVRRPRAASGGRCSASISGPRVAAGQRQVHRLHADEVEAAWSARRRPRRRRTAAVGVGQVDLAEQDGVAAAPAEERAQVGAGSRAGRAGRVAVRLAPWSRGGTARRRRGSRTGRARSQKPMILAISSRTARVGDVEVGLVLVEAVQVVLAGSLVAAPRRWSPGRGTTTPSAASAGGSSAQTYQSR